jgi:predicted HicB family RNase H-like nuclease
MLKMHLDILGQSMDKASENNKLSYKGYSGSIEVSLEDNCLHGRVLFIDDIITYEAQTPCELADSFKKAVDRYIVYCDETGKPANKPYSGTFNVRVGEELHRKAAQAAFHRNITLNDYVTQAIKAATEQNNIAKIEHTHTLFFINEPTKKIGTWVGTTRNPVGEQYSARTH